MAKRATIADLARAAEVSMATVDRVINRRLPVSGATAARVMAAAETIGYHGAVLVTHPKVAPPAAVVRALSGDDRCSAAPDAVPDSTR